VFARWEEAWEALGVALEAMADARCASPGWFCAMAFAGAIRLLRSRAVSSCRWGAVLLTCGGACGSLCGVEGSSSALRHDSKSSSADTDRAMCARYAAAVAPHPHSSVSEHSQTHLPGLRTLTISRAVHRDNFPNPPS
jgi:hypothetical protein